MASKKVLALVIKNKVLCVVKMEALMDKKNTEQYLCVKLGGRWLGVEAHKVVEIINPHSTGNVGLKIGKDSGSYSYHGQTLPTIHLADVLATGQSTYNTECRLLITDIDGKMAGLVVDSAEEIIRVPEGTLVTAGEALTADDSGNIRGTIETEDKKIDVLSLENIMAMVKTP